MKKKQNNKSQIEIKDLLEPTHLEHFDKLFNACKEHLIENKYLNPVLVVVTKGEDPKNCFNGVSELIEQISSGRVQNTLEGSINKFIEYLRTMEKEPYAFIMITGAKMLKVDKEDEETLKRVKENGMENEPSSEVLLLHINTEKGTLMNMFDFIRDDFEGDLVINPTPISQTFETKEEKEYLKQINEVEDGGLIFF